MRSAYTRGSVGTGSVFSSNDTGPPIFSRLLERDWRKQFKQSDRFTVVHQRARLFGVNVPCKHRRDSGLLEQGIARAL